MGSKVSRRDIDHKLQAAWEQDFAERTGDEIAHIAAARTAFAAIPPSVERDALRYLIGSRAVTLLQRGENSAAAELLAFLPNDEAMKLLGAFDA